MVAWGNMGENEFPAGTPEYVRILDQRQEARHERQEARLCAVEAKEAATELRVGAIEIDIRETRAAVKGGWKTAGWLVVAAGTVGAALKAAVAAFHSAVGPVK